jgi:hypothetical protein
MEEVIGSIPIRSTNYSNSLDSASARRWSTCVIVVTPMLPLFEGLQMNAHPI